MRMHPDVGLLVSASLLQDVNTVVETCAFLAVLATSTVEICTVFSRLANNLFKQYLTCIVL